MLQAATIAALGLAYSAIRPRRRANKGREKYAVQPLRLAIVSAVLLTADVWAIPKMLRGKKRIGKDELDMLKADLVPRLDRAALSYEGARAEHYRRISDRVLTGIVAAPLLLFADARIRRDRQSVAALYVWAHAVTYTLYSFSPLGPAFVDKYRPIVYYSNVADALRAPGNNRNARFSGHTAAAACAAFFAAKIYNDYHPEEAAVVKAGRYLAAYLPALLLGWLRTKALKHFPSDVLVAIIIGGAFGIGLPQLYKRD